MKSLIILLMALPIMSFSNHTGGPSSFQKIALELHLGMEKIEKTKHIMLERQYSVLKSVNLELRNPELDFSTYHKLILEKDKVKNSIETTEMLADLQFTKLRYKKGIELIKMIYEKILGLDHHFTSLRTFQNISDLTNPNAFPDFVRNKGEISSRMDKKKDIKMPLILESNPFVSLTFSLVTSFLGDGKKENKEADLEKISCVLDFTVKMHTDLNIIFYETEFLKDSNQELKNSAIDLFKEYNSVIDYNTPLVECRASDDWDELFEKLNESIRYLEENLDTEDSYVRKKIINKVNNLEFSIDRLLTFLDRYMDFIIQGEQYYSKFNTILNNYNNESHCLDQLPHQYEDLKRDVDASISKFSEAYSITELKGSKLRDLLYGLPQE